MPLMKFIILTCWLLHQNEYNITNYNYFSIDVASLDVVMNYDQRILSSETNTTRFTMPMRSSKRHYISMNATFTFEEDFIVYVQFCISGISVMLKRLFHEILFQSDELLLLTSVVTKLALHLFSICYN